LFPADATGTVSVALTNTEKQARYRERHLGVDAEKARVGLIPDAGTRAQMSRIARHKGYTITALKRNWPRAPGRRQAVRQGAQALLRERIGAARHCPDQTLAK
jgi:hypothetical protein